MLGLLDSGLTEEYEKPSNTVLLKDSLMEEGQKQTSRPEGLPSERPSDIIIGVMGVIGVGKSTFIQQFISDTVGIGDSLLSYTSVTKVFKCSTSQIPKFYLVDAPGFDDSKRTDTDVLREVAYWLSRAYQNRLKLSGIIYLHRISDVRVGSSGVKNLRRRQAPGDRREAQLKNSSTFWSTIIAKGGKVFRHDQGATSGERIIQYLVDRKQKVFLDIQKDMVNQGKTLEETGAGNVVQEELNQLKAAHARELQRIRNEWKEALAKKDKEWQSEISAYKAEIKQKMRDDEEQRERFAGE